MQLIATEFSLVVASVLEVQLSWAILITAHPFALEVLTFSPCLHSMALTAVIAPLTQILHSEIDVSSMSLTAISNEGPLILLMLIVDEFSLPP